VWLKTTAGVPDLEPLQQVQTLKLTVRHGGIEMIAKKSNTIEELRAYAPMDANLFLKAAQTHAHSAGYCPTTDAGAAIVAGLVQASAINFLANVVAENTNGLDSAIGELAMVMQDCWEPANT